MSIPALRWVFDSSASRGADRLVLLALADRADGEGVCWPSVADIARRANVSERQVSRSLRALAESGDLDLVRNGADFRTNLFRLRVAEV